MRDWTVPSDADVHQVVALAARLENRTYFFDHLENPGVGIRPRAARFLR